MGRRIRLIGCLLMLGMIAKNGSAVVILYTAEGDVTPEAFGFTAVGPVSGQFAVIPSGFPISALGTAVWEASINGSAGGYIYDLDGLVELQEPFRLSAYVRGLDLTPQGGATGVVERNRPIGGAASARGSGLIPGRWYVQQVEWDGQSSNFVESRWLVDQTSGALQPVSVFSTPKTNSGSPGSGSFPNSFAFYAANDGSSFIRTQFDNVKLETCELPCQCPGDYDGNIVIDIADLAAFLSDWQPNVGTTVTSGSGGDFDQSGFVDLSDLVSFVSDWQPAIGTRCF